MRCRIGEVISPSGDAQRDSSVSSRTMAREQILLLMKAVNEHMGSTG